MKEFSVKIIDSQGRKMAFCFTAASSYVVYSLARRRGWQIVAIRERPSIFLYLRRPKPFSAEELSFIFKQLGAITEAGVVFVQAFQLLLYDIRQKKRRQLMNGAIAHMERGKPLSEAVEQTGLFPPLACRILQAGERAGNLEEMLRLLGEYYEQAHKQRRLLAEALAYPIFLCLCLAVFIFISCFFVIPVFEEMFLQMNMPLPEATQFVLDGIHTVRTYGWGLAILFFLPLVLTAASRRSSLLRLTLEENFFRVGFMRKVCLIVCWQRFSRIAAMQVQCGITVLEALEDGVSVVPSFWFKQALKRIADQLERGESFSSAVRKSAVQTPYVETLLLVGETTGRYDQAFSSIAAYYQWRIQYWTAFAQGLLGPVVLLAVGSFIGLLIICLLLPMLDMATGFAVP